MKLSTIVIIYLLILAGVMIFIGLQEKTPDQHSATPKEETVLSGSFDVQTIKISNGTEKLEFAIIDGVLTDHE